MPENKRAVGSVTYRDAEHGYFERRKLRRHAAFWSLWALGVGAVISGDFYGWNLGLDAGGFGGLLIAGIVITVMYYGLCYSIAEMSPALPHTGGAYSFSRSAMGPWGGFITGLAENMEYVITPAVVVGAMGFLSHDIVFELTGADGWWNSPVLWWAIYYIIFVGINILGIEITMRFTVVITAAGARRPRVLLPGRDLHPVLRRRPAHQHPTGGRRQQLPAEGHRGDLPCPALRDLVLPGDRGTATRRRGVSRPEAGHPRGDDLGAQHTGPLRGSHPLPQHGRRWRSRDHRNVGDPVVRRLQGGLRGGHGGLRARADRADRADRQFLHDHLCLRPQHLLAVPRGILPPGSVDHPPDQAHAVRRAHRRRGGRVHPRAGHLLPRAERERCRGQDRRRAAVHGRVRCRDLLLHAVPGVHHAAPQAAEHRAAVPQSGGCLGRSDSGCDRTRCARLALPQPGLPARCRRNGSSTS